MRSILKWLNRTPKSKSRERSVLRPVTPCVSMATHQAPQLGAPPVSQAPSHPCDKTRSKLRFQNPFSSGKTQHARQKAVSHNETENCSDPNPTARHLPKWAFQLIPLRWVHRKRPGYEQEPREPYVSHTADRRILETCVRYAEEDIYDRRRSHISTHFLLGGSQSPPPMLSETCIATPPFDSNSLMEYGRAPSTSLESSSPWDKPPRRDRTSIGLPLPSTSFRLPQTSASSPPAPSSPSRRRNTLVVLRAPHPPSSFALTPLNFNHSRQSSSQTQAQSQPRLSTCSSTVDHDTYKIGSFSNSSLGGRSSPLFYSTEDSADGTIYSPVHGSTYAYTHFQSRLPPIPSTPTTPNTPMPRNLSAPASSGPYQTSNRYIEAPIGTPIARSGSLTVSIHTENGQEDLEFPCPPTRWSGCWFAGKEPDFSQISSRPLSEEESGSRSTSQGSFDETDAECNANARFAFHGRARIPSSSTSSYGASLATPTTPTTPTTHTRTIPHKHTFGLGAASQFSLSASTQSKVENFRPYGGKWHAAVNTSTDSSVDTSMGSVSHGSGYGDVIRNTYMEDEELESIESVCSAFIDVRMHHRGPSFDTPHALSDTDSVADPVLFRMHSTPINAP